MTYLLTDWFKTFTSTYIGDIGWDRTGTVVTAGVWRPGVVTVSSLQCFLGVYQIFPCYALQAVSQIKVRYVTRSTLQSLNWQLIGIN